MPAKRQVIALVCVALLAIAPAAMARKVFLNGVDITGLKNKTFKNATVHIDENGDIHLNAPGYKVQVVDSDPGSQPATEADPEGGANPLLRMRLFLATNPSPGGRAQYDLNVTVNGVVRKVIEAGSPAVVMEVSSWFKKGANTVTVTATKDTAGGRKSVSSADELQLLIGFGDDTGKKVQMKQSDIKVNFKCNASQTSTLKQTYSINAI
jgi:hypothetical protein